MVRELHALRPETKGSGTGQKRREPSSHRAAPPDDVFLLQRAAGNRAVAQLLGADRMTGQTSTVIQRKVLDGETESKQLWKINIDDVGKKSTPWKSLYTALTAYGELVSRNTGGLAGRTDQEKGNAFFSQIDEMLTQIGEAARKLREKDGQNYEGTKGAWLMTLEGRDVPDTRGAARWVQHNFGTYRNVTYLDALRQASESRATSMTTYVKTQEPAGWQQSDDQTKLLVAKRETDSVRVAQIRQEARRMTEKGKPPRDVLSFMSKGASEFVRDVVKEYIEAAGLDDRALTIVGTGSFGSGELFPYSDIDVQLMTTNEGEEGRVPPEQMENILHNIRMRIRLANNEATATGKWDNTLGWDLDQLTGEAYDPSTVARRDMNKALANARELHSTPTGQHLPDELADTYRGDGRGKAAAKAKMELDLHSNANTGEWTMKNATRLDLGSPAFDFKFKFLTISKVFLNVLAMYYELRSVGSWERVDELMKKKAFSPNAGKNFKDYLDITAGIRTKYQFFYEKEGQDYVSPDPQNRPQTPANYPKGYYVLTDDDRKNLKRAQAIQQALLVRSVNILAAEMKEQQPAQQPADAALI